jgi:hypothetical protein
MVRGKEGRTASEWLSWDASKWFDGTEKEKRIHWRNEEVQVQAKERKARRKGNLEIRSQRQTPSRRGKLGGSERKELVVERIQVKEEKSEELGREWRRRQRGELKERLGKVVLNRSKEVNRGKEGPRVEGPKEWKEQVVRVGTGYRVRKQEGDPRTRRFDVGYSDRKTYTRKPGREATVDQSNMGRTLVGKGENARVRVMNAVCAMEKRRRASEYTGSGIRRKSRVGKRKLKPTKPQTKQ